MEQIMADNGTTSGGVGFAGLLAILFIALKLMGHITWSWWWVFSPLWIGIAVVIAIFLIVLICYMIAGR